MWFLFLIFWQLTPYHCIDMHSQLAAEIIPREVFTDHQTIRFAPQKSHGCFKTAYSSYYYSVVPIWSTKKIRFSYLVLKLKYSQKNTYISLSLMTKQASIRYGQHSVKITEFLCHSDFT